MPNNETGPGSPRDPSFERKPDQADLDRRAARAAESLLDNEALTGDLDDQAASQLLNWGTAYARHIAHSTAGLNEAEAEVAMEPRLQALQQWMHSVGQWIVSPPGREAESQRAAFATLIEQFATVYGVGFTAPDPERREAFLSQLSATKPGPLQFIAALRELLEGQADLP